MGGDSVAVFALPPYLSGVGGIATGKKRAYLFKVGSLWGLCAPHCPGKGFGQDFNIRSFFALQLGYHRR